MGRPGFKNQNSSYPRMEPWTDGAPLIFLKSELLPPLNSEDGALD